MKILVFAPHNDDEVLGVGGTIARYANEGNEVSVCEVTSTNDTELANRIKDEALEAHSILGVQNSYFLELPVVGIKDTKTIEVNRSFDNIVKQVKPNVAFIPHKGDMHIDHYEVAQAAMVALRPIENPQLQGIYAYETLSETEWNIPSVDNFFVPNIWNDITDYIEKKLMAAKCYHTQMKSFPHPRSLQAIQALSQLRGSSIGVANAESFVCIRAKLL